MLQLKGFVCIFLIIPQIEVNKDKYYKNIYMQIGYNNISK